MSDFIPLNLTILTVSDTRTEENDTSGQLLRQFVTAAGHHCYDSAIVKDDIYQIRAAASAWIVDDQVHTILITGGTGFHGRDSTPEAMMPLFDKVIDGFGELFRQVSHEQIGSSTIQSRCVGGLANNTVIFCLPGSNNACETGWTQIIEPQLDSRQRPCNFVKLVTTR